MTRVQPRLLAEDCVEFDLDDLAQIHRVADQLRETGVFEEVVPGLAGVSVRYTPAHTTPADIAAAVETAMSDRPLAGIVADQLNICMRYGGEDGPDLAEVCETLKLSEDEFIDRHAQKLYPVEIIGFTPGFAYLGGLSEELSVARRPTPRTRLPVGSVGIAAGYTGIYALSGPGGWAIIGRTDVTLFDRDQADPFRIRPGMQVRFSPA